MTTPTLLIALTGAAIVVAVGLLLLARARAAEEEPAAAPAPAPARREAAEPSPVTPVLALTRELLGMDLALLTEIVEDRETVRHAVGRWPGVIPADVVGASIAFSDTFCARLLAGEIDHAVPDVVADRRVRRLPLAVAFGVGAWIGVPVRAPDRRLYLLCCLARAPRPELGARDVTVLRALAATAAAQMAAAG